jgi:hypothetical protein
MLAHAAHLEGPAVRNHLRVNAAFTRPR